MTLHNWYIVYVRTFTDLITKIHLGISFRIGYVIML